MKRTLGWILLLLLVDLAVASAADRWTRNKGDCDVVLQEWRGADLERLRECTMRWEMYRNVQGLDAAKKSVVHDAFDRLYSVGDQRDAVMALSALDRLGLQPRTVRGAREAGEDVERPGIEPTPVDTPAEPDPEAARASYKTGVKLYKRRKNASALAEFLSAAELDPDYAPPHSMAARAYMRLKKPKKALDSLLKLRRIDNKTAQELMDRAGKDKEFKSLRGKDAFKALTGVALIQILNGAGADGKKNVVKFRTTLEDAGIPVASVANDRRMRSNNYLYAKEGFNRQAEDVRRLLKLGLVHKRTIDWDTPYDVIFVHGIAKASEWIDDEAEKSAAKAAKDKAKAEEEKKKKDKAKLDAAKKGFKDAQDGLDKAKDFDAAKEAEGAIPSDPTTVIPDP